MKRCSTFARLAWMALAVPLTLLAPSAVQAQAAYKIQPIVTIGDVMGEARVPAFGSLAIGALNDRGQIVFDTESPDGGHSLVQYADGTFTPIVVSGGDAPGGNWSAHVFFARPTSMNQLGSIVFTAPATIAGETNQGIFLWDAQTRQVSPLALVGMPALQDTTFAELGEFRTTINNRGEVAFAARTRDASGKVSPNFGVFFRAADGQLLPVALPDQALPDGGQVNGSIFSVIDDAGRVASLVVPKGRSWPHTHAYLWEKGEATLLAASGTDAPGGGRFVHVDAVYLNNKNPSALVTAGLRSGAVESRALYRFAEGKLTAVAVPGQEMPGGGTFRTQGWISVSYANDAGQHAFFAEIREDGRSRTAAYLLEPDGKLSLILKSGMTTDLGTITRVGFAGTIATGSSSMGVGLNNKGQIALPVQIDNGPATIVLLAP